MEDTTTTEEVVAPSGEAPQTETVEAPQGQVIGGMQVDANGYAVTEEEASQPEEATETAEVKTEDTQPTSTEAVETVTAQPDELTKWAQAKGIDPNDPSAALKMAREAEQRMHQATEAAAAAKKQAEAQQLVEPPAYEPLYSDPNTDLSARLVKLEVEAKVATFYAQNPDAKALDAEMSQIAVKDPVLAAYVQRTGNIETLYNIAKANVAQNDVKAAEERGAARARAELAKASKAGLPQTAATQAAPTQKLSDEIIGQMSIDEFNARREEINAWAASGAR